MYNNSGGVTLLQNAPKAWLLWAVASPLALWLVFSCSAVLSRFLLYLKAVFRFCRCWK